MASREDRDGFERFYRVVRDDLLLQTFALTGDLSSAEKAVRDALVVAWHHWRKVSLLDDPVGWVRPLAWSRAQRRHTTRWWHRARGLAPQSRATLDALGALTATQRKALLLTVLTAQPLPSISTEVGLSRAALEQELQLASAQFSLHRDVASTAIRPAVEALRVETGSVRWPRPSILVRAGTSRRRSHTAAGVVAVAAATVLAGSLVTDADGVTPVLAGGGLPAAEAQVARTPTSAAPEPSLSPDALLDPTSLDTALGAGWSTLGTSRNTEGDGLEVVCQRSRYADPLGVGVQVRTYTAPLPTTGRRQRLGSPTEQRTAVQAVERSADAATAGTTYDLVRSWYGACVAPRVQLVDTLDVTGVGDAASLVVLRSWAEPVTTTVVGVARTGDLTTTVAASTPGSDDPDVDAVGTLLGDAVGRLCRAPGGSTCVVSPVVADGRPLPLVAAPAMIGEMDLPPVGRVDAAWAGTVPTPATTNDAATRCDDADFSTPDVSRASTRSFVIPDATDLPPQFGLTETVGALPQERAEAFVETIRTRMARCPDRDLVTEVTPLDRVDSARRSLSSWRLRVEVDDGRFVDYQMAILRSGTSVAQIGFIAAPGAEMTDPAFRALCARALQRLDELPDPA